MRLRHIFTTLLVLLCATAAAAFLGLRLLGFQPLYITSGSMGHVLPKGSLIYVEKVPSEEIQAGDVITYLVSENEHVTHRVIAVDTDAYGERCYYTKGDANSATDVYPVSAQNVIGIPRVSIPYLGILAQWLQTPHGSILGMAFAAAIVIVTVLPDLMRKKACFAQKAGKQRKDE